MPAPAGPRQQARITQVFKRKAILKDSVIRDSISESHQKQLNVTTGLQMRARNFFFFFFKHPGELHQALSCH